ncbi:MAG TPA: hypothetical protein VFE33_21440 [Thermoanaerobaculia bacterium]|nr:hypothetical protein [Thermoanaerobaculia bacterium]
MRALPSTRATPRTTPLLARAAVPVATFAAVAVFAAHEVDRAAAAETAYLGGVAAAVLAAIAALAPSGPGEPALELGLGATLAVTLLWTLPDGPGRGAALGLLLTALFALAAARRLSRGMPALTALPARIAIPLALGVQLLVRGDRLLAPRADLATWGTLLGLPLLAGMALSVLARRHGGALALLAGGTAAVLTPGWSLGSALALVALAAGSVLGEEPRRSWRVRTLAGLALLAPLAWEPRAALLGMAAGIALAAPQAALAPALGLAVLARLLPPAPEAAGFGIVTLPLLVPAFLLLDRGRWERPAAALLLTVAARMVPGPAALAAPLALAALSIRKEGAGAVAQRVWTGALLFGTCLLAAYPWLRPAPLGDLVALLGSPRIVAAVVVALVLALELGSAMPWGHRLRQPVGVAGIAGIALFLVLLVRLPPPAHRLLRPAQALQLDATSPAWETALPAGTTVSGVAVESVLTNSADLPPEAPVATLRLSDGGGPPVSWTLRTGSGTGEWAARRPDVLREARAAGKPVPAPWMGWVAGSFFGQRYRAFFALPSPHPFARLRIERFPGLPPDLTIAVQQIEVQR